MRLPSILGLVVVLFAVPASAEIITDRPDAAESSRTVGEGRVQVETGVDASFAGDTQAFAFPTKLRVGVIEPFELHLESDIFTIAETEVAGATVDASSVSALDAGGKLHLVKGQGMLPSIGLLAAVTLPLDEGQGWGLTGLLAADFELTDIIGLGTNIGVFLPLNDEAGDAAMLFAVALGVGLPPVPALGLFVETFGSVGNDFTMGADGGLTYLLADWLQLDAYARTGLVNNEEDIGFGGGVSAKF